MLGIVLAFTSPVSEEVHRKLIAFVEQHTDHLLDSPELSTSQYARHCIKQLEKKSPTAVVATLEAVRQVSVFALSIFVNISYLRHLGPLHNILPPKIWGLSGGANGDAGKRVSESGNPVD